MISVSKKTLDQLKKPGRKSFALLKVYARGESSEVTSETDWGNNAGEDDVDYTSSPPEAGTVILAADAGVTEDYDFFGETLEYERWDKTTNAVDYLSDSSDDTYVYDKDVGTEDHQLHFGIDGATLMAAIPESATINSIKIMARCRGEYKDDADNTVKLGFLDSGDERWSDEQAISDGSWSEESYTWSTDPDTSAAWLRSDLAGITEIRISAYSFDNPGGWPFTTQTKCSKLWIRVNYTGGFETDGYIVSRHDLGTPSDTDSMIFSSSQVVTSGTNITHRLYRLENIFRPELYHDSAGDTTDESNAYDTDKTTASTTTPAGTDDYSVAWGRNAGNDDQWGTETGEDRAVLCVTLSKTAGTDSGDYTVLAVETSAGTTVDSVTLAQAAISETTYCFDVTAYIGDLADLRVEIRTTYSSGGGVISVYDIWVEEYSEGDYIVDGEVISIDSSDTVMLVKSDMTSDDGGATPKLNAIELETIPRTYRFSTLNDDTLDAMPLIAGFGNRNVEVDVKDFISRTSDCSVDLIRTSYVDWFLRQEHMRGLSALMYIGAEFPGMTEDDLIPYYSGKIVGYKMKPKTVSLSLSDASKDLTMKWPVATTGTTAPSKTFSDSEHMVEVMQTILSEIGISGRYINSGSFLTVQETAGDGDPASSNFIVYRGSSPPVASGTTVIVKSEEAKKVIASLCEHLGAYLVTQEDGKLNLIKYTSSLATDDTWYDDDIHDPSYDPGLDSIINACYLYYDWSGADEDEAEYSSIYVYADSTSISDWDITKTKIIKSPWLAGDSGDYYGDKQAEHIVAREVDRLKDGMGIFTCSTSLAKCEVQVGDRVAIDTDLVIHPDIGEGDIPVFLVIQKTWDVGNDKINWKLMEIK